MGDSNRSLDSPFSNHANDSVSPPSLKDGKSEKSDIFRSSTSSPLLNTEPLPSEDQVHCPYCHKDFRKPRVLDCLHSMCEDCIIAQLDGRREAKKAQEVTAADSTDCELEGPKVVERPTPPGVIRCPICLQESHVGNDVRYVHTMLLDYVRLFENKEVKGERRCRACKSEQPAVAFCKQCQSDLCSNCLSAHSVMRMFDGHEALTYAELDRLGERDEVRPVLCPTHHMPFKVLCATCETLACKSCLEMEHITHKVIEVNDLVVNAIQKEIRTLSDEVHKKWRESMAEWSAIPDRSSTLFDQYEVAKARVEQSFEDILKAVEVAKAKKLAELEEARHKQEQGIEDLYHKMNLNEARVNDAINFTNRLLEKSNGMELLASRRKVVQQMNNLAHTMPALGIQVELEYQPLSKKQLEAQLGSICGAVVGRMVSASVKEPSASSVISNSTDFPPIVQSQRSALESGDWQRTAGSNGTGQQPAATPSAALGAIGTERKKAAASGTASGRGSSAADAFGGWPPSSNPPDLPSPVVNQNSQLVGKEQPPAFPGLPAPVMPGPGALMSISQQPPPPVGGGNLAAAVYNNYQWPPSSNPPPNAGMPGTGTQQPFGNPLQQLAQAQRQVAAMVMQRNGMGSNPLLMQAACRNLGGPGGVDPLLSLGGLANVSLGPGLGAPAPVVSLADGLGQRTSPQEGQGGRLSDLKIHSVFGTSAQGSSIRELHCPSGFCLSDTDDILIADTNNHRIVVCGPPHPWKIGRPGTDDGMLCFPRKVIALKGETSRYVVLDKGADGKTRAQIFDGRGEFQKRINMVPLVPRGGIEVSASTCSPTGQLVLVDTSGVVYCIDVDIPRVVFWFDASSHLGEASDVAMYEKNVYITDFKHHCVQVFNSEGQFIRKLGEPSQTPYPIGIDISKNGDVLVADTHGNHLHVVVFSPDGHVVHSFTHNEFRLSRCVGLRVAGSGHIVTLCKHNHTLFVFKPLYIR